MDFGTENAKDLTLRFYARGNVPGEYYVTFTNAGVRTLGASQYANRGRLYTKGFTIDEPNQWKLYQITCEGDKVNEPSSGLTGCWNYPNKRGNWPGLQVNWCVGSAGGFQAENAAWKSIPPNGSSTNHTLAIRTNGSLWAWGLNSQGQLGNGTTAGSYSPVQVGEDTDWESVDVNASASLALKTDGSLWTWGNNASGQLGSGTIAGQSSTPSEVDGGGVTWGSASCGVAHTLAIKKDGSLWAWGNNIYGQLGLGISSLSIPTPTRVSPIGVTWNSVSCGYAHTLAIKSDGTLWAWGYNIAGQLGLGDGGSGTQRYSPVKVGEDNDWASVSCGWTHTLALKTDGSLWAWGSNYHGQLGLGYFGGSVLAPERVLPIGVTWDSVSCGDFHTLAIKSDGTLWAWGSNQFGQLGLGNSGFETNKNTPVPVGQQIWNKVCASGIASFALGVGQNSYLYSWGENAFGMLGQGDLVDRYDPTLLTLLVSGDAVPTGSWRYADGIGNVWASPGQVNLLSATGNYLDIAEVSLVDANYTKEIYFPRSDSEIITECRKYFFGSKVYQSETTPYPIDDYGTFNNIGLDYFISTNEMTVSDMPDIVRWPHNGSPYSELFSSPVVTYDGRVISVPLAETCFSRAFNCIGSAASTNVFPASNTTLPNEHKDDYNINNGTVNYVSPAGTYTTATVVQAIVTHTDSPFGNNAKRESLGWDGDTSDMINYFMHPYGYRGFCSPRVFNVTDNTASRFTQLNRMAVQYSNRDPTTEDVILAGRVWLDTEFAYGD
jgi:alpha-tubulin suppressor-like RCC1 family protein